MPPGETVHVLGVHRRSTIQRHLYSVPHIIHHRAASLQPDNHVIRNEIKRPMNLSIQGGGAPARAQPPGPPPCRGAPGPASFPICPSSAPAPLPSPPAPLPPPLPGSRCRSRRGLLAPGGAGGPRGGAGEAAEAVRGQPALVPARAGARGALRAVRHRQGRRGEGAPTGFHKAQCRVHRRAVEARF